MGNGVDIDLPSLDMRDVRALVVGFSGGLDSTVLLHALAAEPAVRQRGLRALHVHHGLQPSADAWASHCAAVCAAWEVPLDIVRVSIEPDGHGTEAAARDARHAALRRRCGPGDVAVLAHHREDQAETFLLRALRASGPDGLASMRSWRRFGAGWLWRPLLATSRGAIERYAIDQGLRWVEDPSNGADAADRNYLRLHVMPALRARWPHAAAALAEAAAACDAAASLLDEEDARALDSVRAGVDRLDVPALLALPVQRRARLLRAWVAVLGYPPLPRDAIRRIETELLPARPDAQAVYRCGPVRIRRWRRWLYACGGHRPIDADWSAVWHGDAPLPLPDGGRLCLDRPIALPSPLQARLRVGGERIRLPGRRHRHALKHVLQELGVPPWTREQLPLLFAPDGELLAAGDVVVSATLQEWLDAEGARLVHRHP